jgi:acetyl esterase/lipase
MTRDSLFITVLRGLALSSGLVVVLIVGFLLGESWLALRDVASQPINYVTPGDPPALLMHGGDDTTVEPGNTERLAARLREAGVGVTVEMYEDLGHAALVAALAPPLDFMAATLEDSQRFIERLTAAPGT